MISAHSNFSENTQTEKMVDRSGQPDERNSSNAQIRTPFEEQRQLSRNIAKKSVITNSKQLTQKNSTDFYEKNYGDKNCNFVTLANKVLQRWKNCGNYRVLLSIRSRDESSSRIRTLFWKERNKILFRCGKYSTKKLIWENQHLSWIMYTWDALKENAK